MLLPKAAHMDSDRLPRTQVMHNYEMSICAYVTSLILTGCRKGVHIDMERYNALEDCGSARGKEMHRALWRVWTFCSAFGPSKGRQDDTLAQEAWLASRNPTVDLNDHKRLGSFHSERLAVS